LRTLEGRSDVVSGAAVMADGKQAVSASGDKTLKVWDVETGRAQRLRGRPERSSPAMAAATFISCD
jgi:WD40 repeat protein